MKGLSTFFLSKVHWIIILNVAYNCWYSLDTYNTRIDEKKLEIPVLNRNIKKLKVKLELAKSFRQNLEASKKRVDEITEQIEKVQKQLPNTISDTKILDFFANESSSLNIKKIFLTPMEEEERGFYFAKRYRVKGNGTFLQFLIFFERIATNERLLNVTSMAISHEQLKIGKRAKGRFQLVNLETIIEVFRYNPSHRESRAEIRNKEETKEEEQKKGKKKPGKKRNKKK